jgi:hypothetical protein
VGKPIKPRRTLACPAPNGYNAAAQANSQYGSQDKAIWEKSVDSREAIGPMADAERFRLFRTYKTPRFR